MICVDITAPRAVQLRVYDASVASTDSFRCLSYTDVLSQVIAKVTELQNQQSYLEVLEEVKNRLDQEAQKFEFSSKISQLKSCMKKSRDLLAFFTANATNEAVVLRKIQDNFELSTIGDNANAICLLEELEIKRKMNRKYEKLIEKHLKQQNIAKSLQQDVSANPYFEEIKAYTGTVIIDLANKDVREQLNSPTESFNLTLDTFINKEQQVSMEKCKAIGAGLASNTSITELTLNLSGTGVNGERLESIVNGIAKNKSIKKLTLDLAANMICQSDVKILNVGIMNNASMNELNLDLSFNDIQGGGVKDLGFAFSKNSSLNAITLDVTENDLSKRGFKHFEQFVKNKSALTTKHNLGISNKNYQAFRDFQRNRLSVTQSAIVHKRWDLPSLASLLD